jgi:hypothetical protein
MVRHAWQVSARVGCSLEHFLRRLPRFESRASTTAKPWTRQVLLKPISLRDVRSGGVCDC